VVGGFRPSKVSSGRFRGLPAGPGHGSQPSCVSLTSSTQEGKGAQVPSAVQAESTLGPTEQGNWQRWLR